MATLENSNVLAAQVAGVLQLERSRRRWRLVAGIAVLLFVLNMVTFLASELQTPEAYIAQVTLDGVITDDFYQQSVLADLKADPHVKAVILYVDSAGGTMVGGINLYEEIRQLAAEKPVVTVMGTVAASAGYMVAIAADYVVANPGTLTGSIGVLLPLIDATELAAKVGIKSDEVTSGALKAATSPLTKRGEAEKTYLKETVLEMQKVFLDMVLSRRALSVDAVQKVADGRIVTGVSAKALNLVDALGNRKQALTWLEETHSIAATTPVVDIATEQPEPLAQRLLGEVSGALFSTQMKQAVLAKLF